jgi:hypothetical protein
MWLHLITVSTPSLLFSDRVVEAHEPMLVRHSVRNLPLNDSMDALSVGVPGREKSSVTRFT